MRFGVAQVLVVALGGSTEIAAQTEDTNSRRGELTVSHGEQFQTDDWERLLLAQQPMAGDPGAEVLGSGKRASCESQFPVAVPDLRPGDYIAPETTPELPEARACVHDTRPKLDRWCERRRYSSDGYWTDWDRRVPDAHGGMTEESRLHWSSSSREPDFLFSSLKFDARGRLVARNHCYWCGFLSYDETFSYDPQGWLREWTVSTKYGGEARTYGWHLEYRTRDDGGRSEVPSQYRDDSGTVVESFQYDSCGRLVYIPAPHGSEYRSFDEHGRLRALTRWTAEDYTTRRVTRYFDSDGVRVAEHRGFSYFGGVQYITSNQAMAFEYELTASQPVATRVWDSGRYPYEDQSGLVRHVYDNAGREVVTSTSWRADRVSAYARGANWASHEITRTTYSCSTSDPVMIERDANADGAFESSHTRTWTWLPEERIIRETDPYRGGWMDYHYACDDRVTE